LLRGLIWRNASSKQRVLEEQVLPIMVWVEFDPSDYEQAAQFWADARQMGRQLGDPDLLLAALTYRINGILVSADADFDVLPIRREDWRS
jgi:predicted nucleic acid-binding protein